jgi:Diphosphoinositol pentakisphosphate kinase 2 N-terminal domain
VSFTEHSERTLFRALVRSNISNLNLVAEILALMNNDDMEETAQSIVFEKDDSVVRDTDKYQVSGEHLAIDSSDYVTMNESNDYESASLSVSEKPNVSLPEKLLIQDNDTIINAEKPSKVTIDSTGTSMQQLVTNDRNPHHTTPSMNHVQATNAADGGTCWLIEKRDQIPMLAIESLESSKQPPTTDDLTIQFPTSMNLELKTNIDSDPTSLNQKDSKQNFSLKVSDVSNKPCMIPEESRTKVTVDPLTTNRSSNSEEGRSLDNNTKNPINVTISGSSFGYDSQAMDDLLTKESPNEENEQRQQHRLHLDDKPVAALSLSSENQDKMQVSESNTLIRKSIETKYNHDDERNIDSKRQEQLIDKVNHIPNFDSDAEGKNKSVIDAKSHQNKRIRLGICAMDKKARSKPMAEILSRLDEKLFEIIFFGDDCILNKPVEIWPICDVLIAFFSKGYPIDKAKSYVKTRNIKFNLNDLDMQILLQDRRRVYDLLEASGIDVPKHVYLSRDGYVSTGTGSGNKKIQKKQLEENLQPVNEEDNNIQTMEDDVLVEFDDHIEINGITINKPFVEKPVNAEDHNISIYYPSSK